MSITDKLTKERDYYIRESETKSVVIDRLNKEIERLRDKIEEMEDVFHAMGEHE